MTSEQYNLIWVFSLSFLSKADIYTCKIVWQEIEFCSISTILLYSVGMEIPIFVRPQIFMVVLWCD